MTMPWRAPIYLAPTDAVRACIREAPVARDRDAYHAGTAERGDPYFYCLNQTAGKGREPFDACMRQYGYIPR